MKTVLVLFLIMVLSQSQVNAHLRNEPNLIKYDKSSNPREGNNLWSHAFENVKIDGLKFLEKETEVDNISNKNIPKGTHIDKKYSDLKIDYDTLRTLMKTAEKYILSPSHKLQLSMKSTEPVASHSTTLISGTDISFAMDEKKIWEFHHSGLDSGILGIGAIDMGHGLRQFGL